MNRSPELVALVTCISRSLLHALGGLFYMHLQVSLRVARSPARMYAYIYIHIYIYVLYIYI
jgi:hypothetical protein